MTASSKSSSGNAAIVILVVLVVLTALLVGYKVYQGSQAGSGGNPTIYTAPNSSAKYSTTVINSGDPAIDADSMAIDNSLNNLDTSLKSADAGLTEQLPDMTSDTSF